MPNTFRPRLHERKRDLSTLGSPPNFAGVYTGLIPNYVAFTQDRSRHLSTESQTPYTDLGMRYDFMPYVIMVTESCHNENALIAFFGLPRFTSYDYGFTSVPVWDRSSRLHEILIGSIPNWIA